MSFLAAAQRNDVTVHNMLKLGRELGDIIYILTTEKKHLMDRIITLESIAPKRIQTPDGKTYVWNCPTELIPLETLP